MEFITRSFTANRDDYYYSVWLAALAADFLPIDSCQFILQVYFQRRDEHESLRRPTGLFWMIFTFNPCWYF